MQERFAVAGHLREIARLLEVKGENRFKARAYERAARALETLSEDFDLLVLNRRLKHKQIARLHQRACHRHQHPLTEHRTIKR